MAPTLPNALAKPVVRVCGALQVPGTLSETERFAYYDALIKKYIPGKLLW